MIDAITERPLSVSTDGNSGPYIMVPVSQLEELRLLLDGNGVPYWVDQEAISLDGRPEVTVVNLGSDTDPNAIQKLLDEVR